MYKEDFNEFKEQLDSATDFIVKEKGETVISERHQDDYVKPERNEDDDEEKTASGGSFTDVNFEDI